MPLSAYSMRRQSSTAGAGALNARAQMVQEWITLQRGRWIRAGSTYTAAAPFSGHRRFSGTAAAGQSPGPKVRGGVGGGWGGGPKRLGRYGYRQLPGPKGAGPGVG